MILNTCGFEEALKNMSLKFQILIFKANFSTNGILERRRKWSSFCFLDGTCIWRIGPVAYLGLLLSLLFFLGGCSDEKPDATKALESMANAQSAVSAGSKLGFSEPIDSRKFGLAPNKNLDGKTLAQIITSQTPGRDDGILCSSCHHSTDAQGGYGVPSAKNAANLNLKPTDVLTGRTWVGSGGWAERFVKNNTKPDNLKIMVQAWINNGYK
jgi:hypothetical protein